MDENIVGDAVRLIGAIAIALHSRDRDGDRQLARAIGEQVKRIQQQLSLSRPPENPCRNCGRPVPDVPIGRPRLFCSEPCRRSYGRRKVTEFPTPAPRIEA